MLQDASHSSPLPFDPLTQQWSADDFKTHRLFVESDKENRVSGLFFDKVHSGDETGKGILGKWFIGWKEHRMPDRYSIEKIKQQLDNIATDVVKKEKEAAPKGKTDQEKLNDLKQRLQTLEKLKANLLAHNIYIAEYNQRFALGNKSWVACPHHTESLTKLNELIDGLKQENTKIIGAIIKRNSQDLSFYSYFLQELQQQIKEDQKSKNGDGLFRESGSNERAEEILTGFMVQRKVPYGNYRGGDIIAMGTAAKRLFTKIMPDEVKQRLQQGGLNTGTLNVEQAHQQIMKMPKEDREILKQLAATLKLTNDTYWAGRTGAMPSVEALMIAFKAADDFISKDNLIVLIQNYDQIFS